MAEIVKQIEIETSKAFKVPVERLYQAWINDENLKAWWHPFNKNLREVVNDLRKDGIIEYRFDGEQKCNVTGRYKEVEENKRLVYSWDWDLEHDDMQSGEFTLTIDFIAEGEGSRLNIKQEGFIDDDAAEPHKKGWDRGLESLRQHLEETQH